MIATLLILVGIVGAAVISNPSDCKCTSMLVEPVCGKDGLSYSSPCFAECANTTVLHYGVCQKTAAVEVISNPSNCKCTSMLVEPVCGKDGLSYSSPCFAECANTTVLHRGVCQSCVCTQDHIPVCGADGKTYSNACSAGCLNIAVEHQGPCESWIAFKGRFDPLSGDCACSGVPLQSVCGSNKKTYSSKCMAECNGVSEFSSGACAEEACICPEIWEPVCGSNGQTYDNYCTANCARVTYKNGACGQSYSTKKHCICPDIFMPVCSSANSTYENSCVAECFGVKKYRTGACPIPGQCNCPNHFKPVCGSDGKTYANECEATCHVSAWTEGACTAL